MFTVNEVAKLIGGTVVGDGSLPVKGMMPFDLAKEGDITFAFDETSLNQAGKSKAACVITAIDTEEYPKTILRVENIKEAMTILYNAIVEIRPPKEGVICSSAVIGKSAQLGKNLYIGPNATIGAKVKLGDNVSLGANCVLGDNVIIGRKTFIYPNVTIYDNTTIGERVAIHSGTVIGADGFGYIPKDGKIFKVPQMGKAIIEDDVEIGANVCIDRGTFANTIIEKGAKIDNLCQIAHNVRIGRNVLMAALNGIAGSADVGDNTMLGGQAGVGDHVKIGRNVKVAARTGVICSKVKDGAVLFGYPARNARENMKQMAFMTWLYKHNKKIRDLLKNFSK